MTTADAIKELLDHWTYVEKSLVVAFPTASREEICRLTFEAMNLSLGLSASCAGPRCSNCQIRQGFMR
jgi:hypothetical protein